MPVGTMLLPRAVMLAAGIVILAGCTPDRTSITTGAIAGGNRGIVVNSPVASAPAPGQPLVGPVEGGLLNTDIGRSLDDADRAIALKAEYEALEYGRAGYATEWKSLTSDVHGRIDVAGITQVNRLDCRDYAHNVWIGGRARVARGTACRQPDGVWRIVG